jgi:hypothetical protein
VSRSEYTSQLKKLQRADDELAARAVAREEYFVPFFLWSRASCQRTHILFHLDRLYESRYKSQLTALKDSITEDQKQRHHNIARIANELQRLVADVRRLAGE